MTSPGAKRPGAARSDREPSVERTGTGAAVPPPRSAPDGLRSAPDGTDSDTVDRVNGPGRTAGRSGDGQVADSADDHADPLPPGDAYQPAAATGEDGLTGRERDILAFEQRWWRHAGAKEQAIRDTFGLSATRYYQLLNTLLDNPAAFAAEPLLIGRLRRLRASRARNRRR